MFASISLVICWRLDQDHYKASLMTIISYRVVKTKQLLNQ